jgi:hypothetical protein
MALLKFKRSAVPAKVPAINDLDLGELAINTYDGKVYTKKDDGTPAIVEVGGTASTTSTLLMPVRNNTGATLTKGTAVYINGALGQNSTVAKAIATSDATSAQTLGIITADLPNNTVGNVTLIGTVTNINTSAYTDGQQLYLSPTTAGALTPTKPYAPNHLVYMAVVEHAHPTQGKLFVKVQNGYEMDELHDVSAQNPANNDGLFYNTTSGLWEKKSIVTALGYTPVNRAGDTMTGQLSITGAGNVNGGNLQLGDKAEGTNKWSVMTGAHYNGVSQAKGVMLIGSYSNSTANQVSIGGNVYEANPATQIVFFTSPTATHATGGLSRLSIDGNGAVTASVDIRSPIYYDSNNTAYYIDPNSTSQVSGANFNFGATGRVYDDGNFHIDGLNSPVWINSIGNSTIELNTQTSGYVNIGNSARAPIFYDSNNTNYYVNPVDTSVLNSVAGYSLRNIEDVSVDTPYGIYFSSNFNTDYAIYREAGAWSSPYPDLRIGFYTGIKMGAEGVYGGMRFYNSSNMATQVMSINNSVDGVGANNVFVNNVLVAAGDIRAPVFYDYNDTSYYVDPNGNSRLLRLSIYVGQEDTGAANSSVEGLVMRGNYNSNSWAHKFHKFDNGGGVPLYLSATVGDGVWTARQGWGSGLSYTSQVFGSFGADSVYSSIFYDTNNTNYYVDPASNSQLNIVSLGAGSKLHLVSLADPNHFLRYAGTGFSGVIIDGPQLAGHQGGELATNMGGDNWSLRWDASGNTFSRATSRAPIFYDNNDTAYYIDPNSTSRLNNLSLNTVAITSGITGLTSAPITTQYANAVTTNTWYPMTYQRAQHSGGYVTHLNTGLYKDVGAWGSGATGWYAAIGGSDVSPTQAWYLTYDGFIQNSLGYVSTGVSFRAPTFYDSQNTNYYVDPVSGFYLGGDGSTTYQSTGSGLFITNPESTGAVVRLGAAWSRAGSYSNGSYTLGSESSIHFWISNSQKGYIDSASNLLMNGSVQAPIFYDSANTGFYVDPNSTSRLERLVLSARYDNYFVGSMAVVNAVNNFQTLTDTFGQMNVMQVSDTSGFTNAPTGLYPYGGVMSWRTENHSYQMYASHTGDLAYKTQWNNDNYSGWQTPVVYGRIGNSASGRAIYGGVYYDTDNTGYFLNPTGTSTLANLDVASGIDSPWYYEAAIEIRERSFGGVLTTSLNNAPRLGFHWGGRVAMQLVLDSGGTFNVMNGDCGAYSSLASGNFTANGSITATGNVTAYSDIRIKANVETIPSALDKLDLIRGVTYTRTDLDDKEQRYAGVIAQEIEAVLPEAVRDLGNIKAVDYNATIALLIEAVKELSLKVKTLEEKDNSI